MRGKCDDVHTMPDQDDVRRIALSLPGTVQDLDAFRFRVGEKLFVWSWMERVKPKKARVPRADVLAVRVADEWDKQILLESDRDVYFTEPHYNGYPAVLVRLPAIDSEELERIMVEAWRCRASKSLLKQYDAGHQEEAPPSRAISSTN